MKSALSLVVLLATTVAMVAPQQAAAADGAPARDSRMKWVARNGAGANTMFWRDPNNQDVWYSSDNNAPTVQRWTVTSRTPFRIELLSSNAAGPIYGYLTDEFHGYRMDRTPELKIPGGFIR